jgi:hypothetical protein
MVKASADRKRRSRHVYSEEFRQVSFIASKPATHRRFKSSRPGNPDLPPNRCIYQVVAASAAAICGCCDCCRALRRGSDPTGALAGFAGAASSSEFGLARLRRR